MTYGKQQFVKMLRCRLRIYMILLVISICATPSNCEITTDDLKNYRDEIVSMFYHGYNNYLEHAFPYDELRPLTCDGFDTWGRPQL